MARKGRRRKVKTSDHRGKILFRRIRRAVRTEGRGGHVPGGRGGGDKKALNKGFGGSGSTGGGAEHHRGGHHRKDAPNKSFDGGGKGGRERGGHMLKCLQQLLYPKKSHAGEKNRGLMGPKKKAYRGGEEG